MWTFYFLSWNTPMVCNLPWHKSVVRKAAGTWAAAESVRTISQHPRCPQSHALSRPPASRAASHLRPETHVIWSAGNNFPLTFKCVWETSSCLSSPEWFRYLLRRGDIMSVLLYCCLEEFIGLITNLVVITPFGLGCVNLEVMPNLHFAKCQHLLWNTLLIK